MQCGILFKSFGFYCNLLTFIILLFADFNPWTQTKLVQGIQTKQTYYEITLFKQKKNLNRIKYRQAIN